MNRKSKFKAEETYYFDNFNQKIASEILIENYYFQEGFHSTPDLNGIPTQELFVVVPKNLPLNNILYRFGQVFTLLTYHNISQLKFFGKYLGKQYYAALVVSEKKHLKAFG